MPLLGRCFRFPPSCVVWVLRWSHSDPVQLTGARGCAGVSPVSQRALHRRARWRGPAWVRHPCPALRGDLLLRHRQSQHLASIHAPCAGAATAFGVRRPPPTQHAASIHARAPGDPSDAIHDVDADRQIARVDMHLVVSESLAGGSSRAPGLRRSTLSPSTTRRTLTRSNSRCAGALPSALACRNTTSRRGAISPRSASRHAHDEEEDQDTKKMDFNEGLKKTPSKKMTSSPPAIHAHLRNGAGRLGRLGAFGHEFDLLRAVSTL